jgi:hypothetical protein
MPQLSVQKPSLPPLPAKPQIPAMAAPAIPQIAPPKVTAPPVSAPAAESLNVLLVVIFCLLAFLAGGVVVYLLMRH